MLISPLRPTSCFARWGFLPLCLGAVLLQACRGADPEATDWPTEVPSRAALPLDGAVGGAASTALARARVGGDDGSTPLDPAAAATPDLLATVQAEVMGTLVALASSTATVTATAPPVLGQAALVAPAGSPEPGCELPDQVLGFSLRVDPAHAPQPTPPAAPYFDSYRVRILEQRTGDGLFRLRAEDPPLPFELELGYGALAPPLQVGSLYDITHYDDLHLPSPAGEGLRIDDERGLVSLGINLRETEGAAERVLEGDRAGWLIQVLPSTCRYTVLDACGFERRAAAVRIRRPEGPELILSAGQDARLEAPDAPAYRIHLAVSHYRLWRGDLPCADRSDWVQSLRITRED